MRKKVKRICAMLLAACLMITMGGTGNVKAEAAAKASRYTNMARMAGVTATSDSTENDNLTADKAIDGDTVNRPSRWSSANDEENHAHWLMLAFPQEIKAYSVQIYWEQRNAEIYEVESSLDGESWQTIQRFEQIPADKHQEIVFDEAVTMKYIRLRTEKMCIDQDVDVMFLYYQNVSLYEFEVYGELAPTYHIEIQNVARKEGVAASADTSEPESLSPDKVIDGDTVTRASRWSSENNWEDNNHWICLAFPQVERIHSVKLFWEQTNAEIYAIEGSMDGENWQIIKKMEQMPEDTEQEITFDEPATLKYLRLRTEKMNVDPNVNVMFQYYQNVSLYEIEVYGEVRVEDRPVINLSRIKGVTATSDSNEKPELPAELAIDGDTSYKSRWSSANDWENHNHWIQLEFPLAIQAQSATILWEKCNAEIYALEYSQDGENWTLIRGFDTIPDPLAQEIVFDEIISMKYIRLRTEKMCTDENVDIYFPYHQNVSIYEFEVYGEDPYKEFNAVVADLEAPIIETNEDGGRSLSAPHVPEGYEISLMGADYEQVIGDDGTVYDTIEDKTVTVGYLVSKDGYSAESAPFELQVPATAEPLVQEPNARPSVIPEIAEWRGSTGDFTATEGARIVLGNSALLDVANEFAADYKDITGNVISVVEGTEADVRSGDFYLALSAQRNGLGEEGYFCQVTDKAALYGEDPVGVYWGTRSLLQILKQTGNKIPKGEMRDYPKYEVRGFGIDVGRQTISLNMLTEIAKTMSWYKMNDLSVHLNDNEILGYSGKDDTVEHALTAYSGFRLESSIQNSEGKKLTSEDMFYTKDGFRDFIQDSRKIGVNITPEIDSPAHSLAITKVFPEYAFQTAPHAVDQIDLSQPGAVEQMVSLYEEYIGGENPVFDRDTTVHIGMDEYFGNGENYRQYGNTLIDLLDNRTVRMWGSLSNIRGATKVSNEDVQMNIWHTMWANPKDMYDQGYGLINSQNRCLYIIPGGGWDYLEPDTLYEEWIPNLFVDSQNNKITYNIPAYSKQMLGGSYHMWHDLSGNIDYGLTESDSFDRFYQPLPVISEKLWAEGQDKTYEELTETAEKTGLAPNSNPYAKAKSQTPVILKYDFDEELCKDSSGNGYDAVSFTGETAQGKRGSALVLDNGTAVTTPLDILGPDYTVSFWINRRENAKDGEQILFEANSTPYGKEGSGEMCHTYQFKAVQKETGKVGFSRENYDYSFDYTLPEGEWVYLTVEGKQNITKLYVNGELVSTLGSDATWETYATFPFPLKRIGSGENGFEGMIDKLTVTDGTISLTADQTALKEKLEEAKAIPADDYTEDSYDVLAAAIERAEDAADGIDLFQFEADELTEALSAAIEGLVKRDKLQEAVDAAEAAKEAAKAAGQAAADAQGKAEEAQEKAEEAAGTAEDAAREAKAAETAAKAAQEKADEAKQAAEAAQEAAGADSAAAIDAKEKAKAAQDAADQAKSEAKDAKDKAETAASAAKTSQDAADTAKTEAQAAARAAKEAKDAVDLAKEDAVAAKNAATAAQSKAEEARIATERAQLEAENAKQVALAAKEAAAATVTAAQALANLADLAASNAKLQADRAVEAKEAAAEAARRAEAAQKEAQELLKQAKEEANARLLEAQQLLIQAQKEAQDKLAAAQQAREESAKLAQDMANLFGITKFKESRVGIRSLKGAKKSVSVVWKKTEGADGYVICYATKSCFEKAKTIRVKGNAKTAKAIRKLKSKQTYYVKVKAYRNVNGATIYSKYSAKKKVKVK